MDRSLLARSKLTNVLSHPSQSYFLPNPSPGTQNCANFTAWGTVHHISHQPLQLSRPNKGYRHKQEGSLQLLLNLQDCTTTSHKGYRYSPVHYPQIHPEFIPNSHRIEPECFNNNKSITMLKYN